MQSNRFEKLAMVVTLLHFKKYYYWINTEKAHMVINKQYSMFQ